MTISPDTISNMADGVKFLHQKGFKYISADLAMGDSVEWTKEKLGVYQTELKKLIEFYLANPRLIPFSMLRVDVNAMMHSSAESHKHAVVVRIWCALIGQENVCLPFVFPCDNIKGKGRKGS